MVADAVLTSRSPAASPTAAATILIADDDPDLLALMARRLVKGGYRVVTAADGQQAFELAVRHAPDLAVLDVMMPKLTGLQVAARLRSDPSTSAIKIILISAGFDAAGGEAMSGSVADGYIVKPFDRGEPANKVGTVLSG